MKWWAWVLVAMVVLALGGAGYWLYRRSRIEAALAEAERRREHRKSGGGQKGGSLAGSESDVIAFDETTGTAIRGSGE